MNYIKILNDYFMELLEKFNRTSGVLRLINADISNAHYKSYLQEVAHFAKNNPQIQTLATVFFKNEQREVTELFYRHAISEIGHDELALNDIQTLGGDAAASRSSAPLPETMGLISFPFYQIQFLNPIGYLGYLYFLEFLPTTMGNVYLQSLQKIGVPLEAMTFLAEHVKVDVQHTKLMEKYIQFLVKEDSDLQIVKRSMEVTCTLYARMIEASLNRVSV